MRRAQENLDSGAPEGHHEANALARRGIMATAAKIDGDEAYVRRMRMELAAAYRLVALFGWDDHLATHLSMRLPDDTLPSSSGVVSRGTSPGRLRPRTAK